jgi:titin
VSGLTATNYAFNAVAGSVLVQATTPAAPTGVVASPGNQRVSVGFIAPNNTGGSPITGYNASCISSNGGTDGSMMGTTSPIVVTGLANGKSYTCRVISINTLGFGAISDPSNEVSPANIMGPILFSSSPSAGPQSGSTLVVLTGSNLTSASQVLFDQIPATDVTVNSTHQITALSPAHAGGTVDITVITPTGEDTLEAGFTYDAPPAMPGTPISAPGDGQVTVSWTQVFSGGVPVSYSVTSNPGGQACFVAFPGQGFPYASCVVSGLANGTAYTFRVTATNTLGSATSGVSGLVTPAAVINGACGAADGVDTLVAPTGLLCASGSASAVNNVSGNFIWRCAGTNGGAIAQCTAPGAASQGSQSGTTTFTSDLGSSGCNLKGARLFTPPENGPGSTMPYGVVNFEMVGCTGNAAQIRMSYAGIVEGMQFWKYVVNSYHNGWIQMPSDQVVLVGNTAEFTIIDNGEWDNDPAIGAIADPGGPGYDPMLLTLPGQPAGVSVTPGNSSATVSWAAPSSGGQPALYRVEVLIKGTSSGQYCEASYPAPSARSKVSPTARRIRSRSVLSMGRV